MSMFTIKRVENFFDGKGNFVLHSLPSRFLALPDDAWFVEVGSDTTKESFGEGRLESANVLLGLGVMVTL